MHLIKLRSIHNIRMNLKKDVKGGISFEIYYWSILTVILFQSFWQVGRMLIFFLIELFNKLGVSREKKLDNDWIVKGK